MYRNDCENDLPNFFSCSRSSFCLCFSRSLFSFNLFSSAKSSSVANFSLNCFPFSVAFLRYSSGFFRIGLSIRKLSSMFDNLSIILVLKDSATESTAFDSLEDSSENGMCDLILRANLLSVTFLPTQLAAVTILSLPLCNVSRALSRSSFLL